MNRRSGEHTFPTRTAGSWPVPLPRCHICVCVVGREMCEKIGVLTSYPFLPLPLLRKLMDSLHLELLHLLAVFHVGMLFELGSEHVP